MDAAGQALLEENATLKAALSAVQARSLEITAELAVAHAKASEDMALIGAQKLQIAKLQRLVYGQKSERSLRLVEQLALTFEELEASATEDELAAAWAAFRVSWSRSPQRGRRRSCVARHSAAHRRDHRDGAWQNARAMCERSAALHRPQPRSRSC
jgi:transposase